MNILQYFPILLKPFEHAIWRLDTAYPFAYTPLVLTDFSDSMNIKLVRNLL
jgi:hypothetical protein